MFYLVFFTIFLCALTFLLSKIKYASIVNVIISYAFLVLLCGFVTYTNDYENYEYLFDGIEISIDSYDPIFLKLIDFFQAHQIAFEFFYIFYIVLYSALLVLFIYKFNDNIFLIMFLFVIFIFLFYTNQIRFFLAFFIAIWATYVYFIKKNVLLSVALFIIAFLCHSSIILILPVVFAKRIMNKKILFFGIAIALFAISTLIDFLLPILDLISTRYRVYILEGELRSSLVGGLFCFLPFVATALLTHIFYVKNKEYVEKQDIAKMDFLYNMSIFYYIYLGIALNYQVIGQRFIYTALLFQLLLFFFINERIPYKSNRVYNYIIFAVVYISLVFCFYVLPSIFLDVNAIALDAQKTFLSNPIIEFFL